MDELKKLQLIFQTLSDYNRLGILKSIADKECAVGEIVKATNLSQPLVSHHLKILKENGILETKRNGPFIFITCETIKYYMLLTFFRAFENSEIKQNPGYRFCPDWIIHKYNTNE